MWQPFLNLKLFTKEQNVFLPIPSKNWSLYVHTVDWFKCTENSLLGGNSWVTPWPENYQKLKCFFVPMRKRWVREPLRKILVPSKGVLRFSYSSKHPVNDFYRRVPSFQKMKFTKQLPVLKQVHLEESCLIMVKDQ